MSARGPQHGPIRSAPTGVLAGLVTLLLSASAMATAAGPDAVPSGPLASQAVVVGAEELDRVDRYLAQSREELGWPGLAAAVVADGEVAWSAGYGTTGPDGAEVTPSTPFLLASVSKSVTAVAVMRLVDQGLVELDAPVTDHLPELAPAGADLTVVDLMHQRTGLTTRTGQEVFTGAPAASLEANVTRLAPLLRPGSPHAYSNANYDALALLVERAAGRPLEHVLQTEVFGPLDMPTATSEPERALAGGLAGGHYHWLLLGYRPHEPPLPDGAVGSYRMFAGAEDVAHLLLLHLGGGRYDGAQVLSPSSLAFVQGGRPVAQGAEGSYGGGLVSFPAGTSWMPERVADYPLLVHDGAALGYRSMMWAMPGAGVGLVLLANGNDATDETALPQVAFNVQRLLFDLDPTPVSASSDLLLRWGTELFALLALVQLGLVLATVRPLRRRWRTGRAGRRGVALLAMSVVVDLATVLALVWLVPDVTGAPLSVVALAPDARIILGVMAAGLALAVGRTLLWSTAPAGHLPARAVPHGAVAVH